MNRKQRVVAWIMGLLVLFAIGTTPVYQKKLPEMNYATPYKNFYRDIFLKCTLILGIGIAAIYIWRDKKSN